MLAGRCFEPANLRERFRTGPPELRQAYRRLLLDGVVVAPNEIVITGSSTILERLAGGEPPSCAPELLSLLGSGVP
jgi:hypothetical protein